MSTLPLRLRNLGQPPRTVPASLFCRVLFASGMQQLGWGLLGFTSIFLWVFVGNADLTSFVRFSGRLETARGVVTSTLKTSFSEGGGDSDHGERIYANEYAFAEPGGSEHRGVSYTLGARFHVGDSATIEYPVGKPSVSRIQGARRAPFGPGVLFVCLLPFLALCFLVPGLHTGIRGVALLASGALGHGTLQSKEPTNVRINRQLVYKLTFSFVARDGQTYEAVARSHQTASLEDEQEEPLLYDPRSPRSALLLDTLPGVVEADGQGGLRPVSLGEALLPMLLPAATIGANLLYVLLRILT